MRTMNSILIRKTMKEMIYTAPEVSYLQMDLEGFICESLEYLMEVDEYQILDEESIDA